MKTMKLFLISDNIDTQVGMRLAGIKGVVVHTREEVLHALQVASKDKEIGIIIITDRLSELVKEEIRSMKIESDLPLIAEIPDRHGSKENKERITRYIKEAIGLKI